MLTILEEAIFDVGYWRWWAIAEPSIVQLEFGGVQLARPSRDDGPSRPIGILALQFRGVTNFAFLTRTGAPGVPHDWPAQLAAGTLESDDLSTAMSYELFALVDPKLAERVFAVPHHTVPELGPAPSIGDWHHAPIRLAFWAGPVGAVVLAAEMSIVTLDGELTGDEIPALKDEWWAYWRTYWELRDTERALPYDGSCEVTIPLKAK